MMKSSRMAILLIILILLAGFTTLRAEEDLFRGLDTYIRNSMEKWKVPGLAVAVVKDDSVILARGYGVRERGRGDKVDQHTLFAIASNTKAFTASLLGMLVDEGKLEWDDRVIDYLPRLQMYDPYVTREISVCDLLTHRSGLPTFGGDHIWIGGTLSGEEIIARLRYLKPSVPFRTRFQYQNLMFLLAGKVVESVRGQSWNECIRKQIFEPLEMNQSNTSVRFLDKKENVATPHEIRGGRVVKVKYDNVDAIAPAGAINSSVTDMAGWMMVNLKEGIYRGERILSEEVMEEMHTIHIPAGITEFNRENFGTRFSGYGLGWGVWDYRGYQVISHGGGLSGMISRQTLIPGEKAGVIILSNLAPNSLPRALTCRILDILLWKPVRDWNRIYLERRRKQMEKKKQAREKLLAERVTGTTPAVPPDSLTGTYYHKFSGKARVVMEEGNLVFRYNPRHTGDLEHWHYNTFRVTWRNPIFDMPEKSLLTFYLDERGEVSGLEVTFYHPIYFQRVD